ncbi:hypothetical protein U1Q18_027281 [Sarracenia purpurea var. burkii]
MPPKNMRKESKRPMDESSSNQNPKKTKTEAATATATTSMLSNALVSYGTPSAPSFSPTSIFVAKTEIISLLDTMISSLKSFEALVHDESCYVNTSLTNVRDRVSADEETTRPLNQDIEDLVDTAHDAIQKWEKP